MTNDKTAPALTPAMKRVLIAVAAVVVIGLVATIWFLSASAAGPTPAAGPTSSASSPSSSSDPGSSPSRGAGTPSPGATAGPLPEATPESGSEVLPPTATPESQPRPTVQPPLVSAPLPASGTKDGGLVKGFPKSIMGPTSKTTIVSSSIASQSTTMQVTLVGRTKSSEKTVRAHYAKLWASLGLQERTTTDGSLTFAGAHESLTMTFDTTGTNHRYTIYGVFRTK